MVAWTSIVHREDVIHLLKLDAELHESRVPLAERLMWHSLLKMVPRRGPIAAVTQQVRGPCCRQRAAGVAAFVERTFQ